jgi:UDP-glucuronate decarboxylase
MTHCRKNIAVTGGAGFIGSHLCQSLLVAGHNVICIDNFYTGSRDNIFRLLRNQRFEVLRHDIRNPLFIEVDEIYNLACPASPVHYQRHPIQTTQVCTSGVINMLDLAKRTGAKILQASTSEVYGNPLVHPQEEGYFGNVNTIGPRACYDEGKRCAETLFFDYYRQENIPIKVARIFNTYGPRMDVNDGRVVSNFIVQALTGKNITIFGDGSQTRSFCYVDDMVRGLILLMDSDDSVTGPINLGNDEEYSMLELADMIIKITGSKSRLIYKSLPTDDPTRRKPHLFKSQDLLGWNASIEILSGLETTINYFRRWF